MLAKLLKTGKYLFILFSLGASLLYGIYWFLKPPLLRSFQEFLSDKFNADVEIRTFSVHVPAKKLVFEDVTFSLQGSAKPLIQFKAVELRYSLEALLRKELKPHTVKITGVKMGKALSAIPKGKYLPWAKPYFVSLLDKSSSLQAALFPIRVFLQNVGIAKRG